ncbi:hypothetical protein ACP6C7_04135 [Mycolicibacterium septicum]|uniref:Uncharacterized protein n=1 Tax=Mycolicibacterium septicum TaxID=98668 RepID=A0ABW9LPL9_9MYCO
MRMHRVREFGPRAYPYNDTVCLQMGFARFSGTPDEADDLARQLVAAAAQVRREMAGQ